jgi:hypothetical protein
LREQWVALRHSRFPDCTIQFGAVNELNFFVKFSSLAL